MARFHPTKRFQLSIASYKGAVTIYDVNTKRKVFHAADAHAAQCRDLCMSPANPDTLISVGYDCAINIFDTRRKVKPVQISYCHPLSTVAASECGNYMCVGNLKGELTTYDLRNPKVMLASKKIHDGGVTRVAFVPLPGDSSGQSFSSTGVGETSGIISSGGSSNKSLAAVAENARSHRDSFCDFLDFHANRGQEKMSPRFVPRRDSFDWEALSRKPHTSDESRLSLLGKENCGGNNNSAIQSDSFDGRVNTSDFLKAPLRNRSKSPLSPLTEASRLSQIKEEEKGAQESGHDSSAESDKENPQIDLQFPTSRLKPIPVNFNSTPNRTSMDGILTASNRPLLTSTVGPSQRKQTAVPSANINERGVQQAINELRAEMSERFDQLQFEMQLQIETNKWQMFTQNFNLWNQRSEQIEEIRDCLGVLLQTDPFVNEFMRLKEENELLKRQLQNVNENRSE